MSLKDTGNTATNIKASDCISNCNYSVDKKSEVSEPCYYNTVSGVSAQYIKNHLAQQKAEKSTSPCKSSNTGKSKNPPPNTVEKKHSKGFFTNLFGRSKNRSISINLPTNHKDFVQIPTYNPMEGDNSVCIQSPVQLSVGPDEFLQLYRQRTLSDCGSGEHITRRQKSYNEESGDFLIDDSCSDMSKFHFLIWKDRIGGTKYFKLLKSLGSDSETSEPNRVFRKFLSDHAAYDLMPHSVKLLTFNTKLTVKKAFFALVENIVKAGVLWDTSKQTIIGMLTITDFMEILLKFYQNQESFEEIENHSIETWKEQLHERALISLGPEDSLLRGCELLLKEKVHRCLILDKFTGNPLYVLTQKRILRFLYTNFEFIKLPDFMQLSIGELNCGTYQNILTISYSTTLLEVLRLFVGRQISALPVIDENNKLVNVFSKVDFANLVPDKLYRNMDMPAEKVLHCRKGTFERAHTCMSTDSIVNAIEKLVNAEVHRLIIVDSEEHIVGILSLSDILKVLISRWA